MTRFIRRVNGFLSGQVISFIIVMLAIAVRIIQIIYYFNIRVDCSYQVMASQNLIHGHGISTAEVFSNDLARIVYLPLIKWPPGYSILLAPLYALSGRNYLAPALTLDILFATLLILMSRRVLKVLDLSRSFINIFTLATAFFVYEFYFISSSDSIAICFFLIALYFFLLLLKGEMKPLKAFILITVFLFITGFLKYLFMPVVFVIPAWLTIKGLWQKKKTFIQAGLLSFFLLALGFSILLLYHKSISGQAAYVNDSSPGFFPVNLTEAYPFIPASFIRLGTISSLLNNPRFEAIIFNVFRLLNVVLLLFATFYFVKKLQRKELKNPQIKIEFLALYYLISMALTTLLIFLSLRYPQVDDVPGHWWTFIEEARYFGFPVLLTQMGMFLIWHMKYINIPQTLRYLFYFFLFLFLVETARGILFTAKRVANVGREEYSWQYEDRFQKYAAAILDSIQQKNSAKKTAVTSTSYYMAHRVSIYNRLPIFADVNKLNELPTVKSSEPVLLLAIIQKNAMPLFQQFLQEPQVKAVGNFGDYFFYTFYVINR